MKRVIYEDALEVIQGIIADNGEDTRADCVYFHELDGRPVCIIGHYLDSESFWSAEDADVIEDQNVTHVFDVLQEAKVATFSDEAKRLLIWVQHFQDRGDSWGYALESAIKCCDRGVYPGDPTPILL